MNRCYPQALTVTALICFIPLLLFPRSLVWSELSEGDLSALSLRVCEWSLVQRADLYFQKSGLKQRWPRAPVFTACTGSMLRDAYTEGPPLSHSVFLSITQSLLLTWKVFDGSNRERARSQKVSPLCFYIQHDSICTTHNFIIISKLV